MNRYWNENTRHKITLIYKRLLKDKDKYRYGEWGWEYWDPDHNQWEPFINQLWFDFLKGKQ